MTADPPAAPCGSFKRPGGYVLDSLAAHEAGGPTPPAVVLAAVHADHVVLDALGAPGGVVAVSAGGSAPLPGHPGWSARCAGACPRDDPRESVAWVWLVFAGGRAG